MYEHYEPSDRVFVDREEYLEWMSEALKRCKEQSVILHLRGIGGIGKSSLLDYWKNTIDETVRLDCEQYTEFFDRLNVIAKGAVLLGVNLRRFDVLWQIKQRFVEGVEPVKEKGREWAKEVVMAIPFIGSLASIGNAIGAVGAKVSPTLKGRYGELGDWLQTRLGKDYVKRLLEILWKEPRHAEFLYLDALLEDLNNRKSIERPIVFLFDHSEHVENERCRWRYRGREINETELWYVFLSSLSNCVGVMASRRPMPEKTGEELEVEESELTELDRESCIELLELRGISDEEVQSSIVSVSGGNPFVMGTLCDMTESGTISSEDLEGLRGDTLEEVRLKTWRRLFNQAQDLLGFVQRAGLIPYFNRRVMDIIAPDMNPDQWDRLIRLSFVRNRGDGTWVLHDLAEELVLAELGPKLGNLTREVGELLEKASEEESDCALLGLSLSVQALAEEKDTLTKLADIVFELVWRGDVTSALGLLDATRIETRESQVVLQGLKGSVLSRMGRVADGEQELQEALERSRAISERVSDELLVHVGRTLRELGRLLHNTDKSSEAEETYREALRVYGDLDRKTQGFRIEDMAWTLHWLGWVLVNDNRLEEAEEMYREEHRLLVESDQTPRYDTLPSIAESLYMIGMVRVFAGSTSTAEQNYREALELFRELAGSRTDVQVRLGVALLNFGEFLRMTGRPYEAEQAFREVLAIARERTKMEPESTWAAMWLAANLDNLAIPLKQTYRYQETEEAYAEALKLVRYSIEKEPDAFARHLAWVLIDYAVLYRETGQLTEAEKACREALELHRNLAAKSPRRHLSKTAWNLNNLGVLLRKTARLPEAEEAYREALEIAREIVKGAPEAVFMKDLLSTVLSNLSVLLRRTQRITEAEDALIEALTIRERLAKKSPKIFLHRVAASLNNQGVMLFEAGKGTEAEDAFNRALQLRRELNEKSPDMFLPGIASTLSNLGILLRRTGRLVESENAYLEAIEIGEELVSKAPKVYQNDLVRTLCNFVILGSDAAHKSEDMKKAKVRLKGLGIKSLPESEEWSEEEKDEANAPGGV